MKSKILLGLMLLNIAAVSFAEDDQRVTTVDANIGNGGIDVGLTHLEKIGGPVDLSAGIKGGMDVTGGSELSAQVTGLVGLNFNVHEVLRLNPMFLYKCEGIFTTDTATKAQKNKVNGCGFRAGGQIFVGERDKFNLGLGYSKSLQDKNHGESHEFQFLIRIPLSANDTDRNLNDKYDMDLNDSPREETNSAKAANA